MMFAKRAKRRQEVSDWTLDLPAGWFMVPLDELDARAEGQWIDDVVAQLQEMAVDPGSPTLLRAELSRVRADVLSRQNPWLSAAVAIRPEDVMTVGCVMLTSVLELEDDEGADAFEAVLEEGFAHPDRGTRTFASRVWREKIGAGELVCAFQRFETVELGEEAGTVEDRTIFGLFPEGSIEMVRLEFRTWDLAAFGDIIEETSAMVRTTRVSLQATA